MPDVKPIIFIPGISGSELFTIDEKYLSDIERKTGMISGENEEHAKRLWLPQGYDVDAVSYTHLPSLVSGPKMCEVPK